MAFRTNSGEGSFWKQCYDLGVAAICYEPMIGVNLSEYPEGEPRGKWAQLKPAQKRSLHQVVYEMNAGDIIYAKEGKKIVGKGVVTGRYQFDPNDRIKDADDNPCQHQVPVDWDSDFPEIEIQVGSLQIISVEKLSPDDRQKLDEALASKRK
jgi:hypothetical protein